MPARSGPVNQEGYPSTPPSMDHSNDPFGQARRYYDNESAEHVEFGRNRDQRETYASDSSNPAVNEYDHNGNYDYRQFIVACPFSCLADRRLTSAVPDTDSDRDVYAERPAPSQESLGPTGRPVFDPGMQTPIYDYNVPPRDAYPAWSADRQIPLSKEEIEDVFLDLTQKFGFQRDSMRNMVCSTSLSHPSMLNPLHPVAVQLFS